MINIVVPGVNGRMGSVIADLINKAEDLQLAGTVTGPYDVLIDFTSPAGTMVYLQQCLANKTAMVIGTTGLSDEQHQQIEHAAMQIPILYSANMSLGVNVSYKLLANAAKMLDDNWKVSIHDVHHQHKKDSPSGTAKQMAKVIELSSGKQPGSVEILSERRGEFAGTHVVSFTTPAEQIMITHIAHDRNIFAIGALTAARWIYKRKPGLYSMQDVI